MSKKSKKTHQKAAHRHKVIIIAVAAFAALLVAAVVAALVILQVRQAEQGEDFTREEELANVAGSADQAIGQGDFDEGVRIYDQAIENTQDNTERAQLLADKATAYFNNEEYDQALETALEADQVDSTAMINYLIAQIYEVKNDNAQAAEYYSRAAERIDPSNPMAEQDKAYYEARAAELRGE